MILLANNLNEEHGDGKQSYFKVSPFKYGESSLLLAQKRY